MDIDLDFKTSFQPSSLFPESIPASMVKNGELTKHPCGRYFQQMPIDPITNLAAIPYEAAEEFGFFKIDLLHLSLLDPLDSKDEIRTLSKQEPDWSLLLDGECVSKLFHVNKHADLLAIVRPKSVIELSDVLALIRPGKRQLLNQYLADRAKTRVALYEKTVGYYFKRSHAIAYALSIVVQLHLISQKRL